MMTALDWLHFAHIVTNISTLSACYLICVAAVFAGTESVQSRGSSAKWLRLGPVCQCPLKKTWELSCWLCSVSSLRRTFWFLVAVLARVAAPYNIALTLCSTHALLNSLLTHATVSLSFPLMHFFKLINDLLIGLVVCISFFCHGM